MQNQKAKSVVGASSGRRASCNSTGASERSLTHFPPIDRSNDSDTRANNRSLATANAIRVVVGDYDSGVGRSSFSTWERPSNIATASGGGAAATFGCCRRRRLRLIASNSSFVGWRLVCREDRPHELHHLPPSLRHSRIHPGNLAAAMNESLPLSQVSSASKGKTLMAAAAAAVVAFCMPSRVPSLPPRACRGFLAEEGRKEGRIE